MAIPDDTSIGPVSLTVRDLDGTRDFYERVVGLRTLERRERSVSLGAGEGPLVELVEDAGAPPRPHATTGLYHLAILVPERVDLAHALRRVADARRRLVGAADHLVSEALYLEDPEGNGIEIYRDRPREQWRRDGDELRMATLPLDLQSVIGELGGAGADPPDGLPAGTRIGHVHLNVADLAEAEGFYGGLLGFAATARNYPGALFLSAGGYHHHIGLNTWTGEGASPPPEGATGLRAFEVTLPSEGDLRTVADRLLASGADVDLRAGEAAVRDPSRNRLLLRVAG